MHNIQSQLDPVSVAGLALAASSLAGCGLVWPTASEILSATGAPKTTAYRVRAAIIDALPGLLRPPGRPVKPRPEPAQDELRSVSQRVLRFIFDHPGCVSGSKARRRYSGGFSPFVLELCAEHRDLPLEDLADAAGLPPDTLKDWLRGRLPQPDVTGAPEPDKPPLFTGIAQIETVLQAFSSWKGGFRPFCEHVQLHLRIPLSRAHISDILEAEGVRIPKRRGHRPPDASALRGAFETFFPGAQWVGDGSQMSVELWGQRFVFNLELNVDPDTGAFVGASIGPTEDSAAVVAAFQDGVETTGKPPLGLLLDNKPSNHTEAVDEALGETVRTRSRPFTPTDKPHVEGAFGLFEQTAPTIYISATDPTELAEQILRLIVTTWLRARNHRPRDDRGGLSRVELYQQHQPTQEEIQRAKAAFAERQRKQERARQTRAARQDPTVRAVLDDAFQRLGLDDPDAHMRIAIASWPIDAILAGIAIFQAKQDRGTLPEGVDARYMRGIIKNIAEETEGWDIAVALLRERLNARDHALSSLTQQRATIDRPGVDVEDRLIGAIDRAMDAQRHIDHIFWLLVAADIVGEQSTERVKDLLRVAARRVHTNRRVSHRARLAAVRFLFAKAVPVV